MITIPPQHAKKIANLLAEFSTFDLLINEIESKVELLSVDPFKGLGSKTKEFIHDIESKFKKDVWIDVAHESLLEIQIHHRVKNLDSIFAISIQRGIIKAEYHEGKHTIRRFKLIF